MVLICGKKIPANRVEEFWLDLFNKLRKQKLADNSWGNSSVEIHWRDGLPSQIDISDKVTVKID